MLSFTVLTLFAMLQIVPCSRCLIGNLALSEKLSTSFTRFSRIWSAANMHTCIYRQLHVLKSCAASMVYRPYGSTILRRWISGWDFASTYQFDELTNISRNRSRVQNLSASAFVIFYISTAPIYTVIKCISFSLTTWSIFQGNVPFICVHNLKASCTFMQTCSFRHRTYLSEKDLFTVQQSVQPSFAVGS